MNALASQGHRDDHKGHWQDELRQISRIIRSIKHLSMLGKLAWTIYVLLLISSKSVVYRHEYCCIQMMINATYSHKVAESEGG